MARSAGVTLSELIRSRLNGQGEERVVSFSGLGGDKGRGEGKHESDGGQTEGRLSVEDKDESGVPAESDQEEACGERAKAGKKSVSSGKLKWCSRCLRIGRPSCEECKKL